MSVSVPSAAQICRLDRALVQRVRDRESLPQIYVGCIVTIAVGAAAYGATIGMWRAPSQALFAALKLVALFGGLLLLTTVTNAVVGGLLRTRLSFGQVATSCALGVAVTAAILGGLAPVSAFFVSHAPAPSGDYVASMRVAYQLLTGHVLVFALAGLLGVRQVYVLLRDLVEEPAVARRALWAWLLVEGLVGAELSWVLRPFLGKPGLEVALLRPDAFDRSFFEEIVTMAEALAGPVGPWIALILLLSGIAAVATSLGSPSATGLSIEAHGLDLHYAADAPVGHIGWPDLRFVRRVGTTVELGRADEGTLRVDVLTVQLDSVESARRAYEDIELARYGHPDPFRA